MAKSKSDSLFAYDLDTENLRELRKFALDKAIQSSTNMGGNVADTISLAARYEAFVLGKPAAKKKSKKK